MDTYITLAPPRRTCRTYSETFKQSLIEACGAPSASVAGVAINAHLLRRRMHERGVSQPVLSCEPLRAASSASMAGFVRVQLSPSLDASIRLELRKGAAVVTVDWPASSAAACRAWLRAWLR